MRRYVWMMRILGILYALFAIFIFFFPNELFYLINVGPKVFKVTEAIPDSVERYWLVMASGAYAMLAGAALLSAETPFIRGYALIHQLGKVVMACGFVYLFLNQQRLFAYLCGAVIDSLIALLVTWNMLWLKKSTSNEPDFVEPTEI